MADPVDELVAAGVKFAERGEYSEAIDRFKQADAIRPRALHACLIALAYTRRALWAQAEIALASCHERASAGESLPDWIAMDPLDQELSSKLDSVDVAPITVRVEPPAASATISISSFRHDETFAPRVLHLAPGTYAVTATVPGRGSVTQTIVVVDRAPQTVTLRFVQPEPPSPVPWVVLGAGGLMAAGGLAADLLLVQPVRSKLEAAPDRSSWDAHSQSFDRRRALTLGLFAGAAITAAAGVALRFTVYRSEVTVSASANGVALAGTL